MLTLQIPMLLALLGTALMAVVIFAPTRVATPAAISFAPPPAPPLFDQWQPLPSEYCEPLADEPFAPPPLATVSTGAAWPAMVDQRASGCDAAARLGLVEALAAVGTPWSETILRHALDDEPDPAVRAAVVTALGA